MKQLFFENLTIGYKIGRGKTKVVAEGLSATLESGKLTCLLGRNGTGKSTLLRTLAGLQPPLNGQPTVADRREKQFSTVNYQLSIVNYQLSVALVLTERPDLRNFTASEVVGLGRTPHTNFWGTLRENDRRIVAESLQLVGIESLANRPFETLSDGEQQKVVIAKALAQQTPIIILDEPTAFLDYPSKREVFELLKKLAHEHDKAILLTTHDIALAKEFADRTWLLADGKLLVDAMLDEK
ncbi:MAG: ABC transporter ATP-binding protein [Prevotella sp.]|nr:ABC transporter ATP-binding protein [Prevotella sp.]